MTTPDDQPEERPATGPQPGHYGEIAPGVPRYGQYAPAGWQPPNAPSDTPGKNDAGTLPPASSYPGFGAGQAPGPGLPHRGAGPVPPGTHFAAPKQVVLASRLIMAAGVIQALALVVWVVAMTTPAGQNVIRPIVEQAFTANPEAAAGVSVQTMVNLVGGMLAVVQLASTIIYFWMAAAVRKGKRWARTTSLVLAIVSIVLVPEGASYSYYTAARIVVGLVAVFLLFRGPAKEYFLKPNRGPHGY